MSKIKSLIIAGFIMLIIGNQVQGQYLDYCSSNRITEIAWSPDGEQLAVMTPQGIHIYNPDLELVRSIVVPSVYVSEYPYPAPVWSPDSQWILAANRVSVEFLGYGGIVGSSAMVNTSREEVVVRDIPLHIVQWVWSPDNRYILSAYYESSYGINLPYTELRLSSGVIEEWVEPKTIRFDGIHLTNLQWNEPTVFTAGVEGLTLSFDSTSLEPNVEAPVLYPSWWVPNHDGTREAAQKPDILFYVQTSGEAEQFVYISAARYFDGEMISIPRVDRIYWLTDNYRLVGLYPRYSQYLADYPELNRILQGTIVDAETATEINHFLIYADSPIEGYSVSQQDGSIAITRNETHVELWNPFTEEKYAETEVPLLELEALCSE